MKTCCKCKETREESEFTKDKNRKDGLDPVCKICFKIYREKTVLRRRKYDRSFKRKLVDYKCNAKKRNIVFDLTDDQFESFWQQPCFYCGDEIDTIGIDRINNDEGYSIENCRSCCSFCNKMKLNHKESDFINHIQKILNNFNS